MPGCETSLHLCKKLDTVFTNNFKELNKNSSIYGDQQLQKQINSNKLKINSKKQRKTLKRYNFALAIYPTTLCFLE